MSIAMMMFGGPGSGKGTQSKILEALGTVCVSSGDCFRRFGDKAQMGDPMARKILEIMNQGNLIDDDTTMKVVADKVHDVPVDKNFLFDAPRSAEQVRIFCEEMMDERKPDKIVTIYLNASRNVCLKRLRERSLNGVRTDDNEEVIKKRLDEYDRYAPETISAMRKYSHFIDVDASFKTIEVAALMLAGLSRVLPSPGFINVFSMFVPREELMGV